MHIQSIYHLPICALSFTLITLGYPLQSEAATNDQCLLDQLSRAEGATTVDELRAACTAGPTASNADSATKSTEKQTLLQKRFESEFDTASRPYTITTHRPNYILPYTHNSKVNRDIPDFGTEGALLKDEEIKFQVSMKLPIWRGVFDDANDLYFAFTSTAWWQAYNDDLSDAFRETNYEPEIFLRHFGGPEFLGGKVAGFDIGFNHQSNGRAGSLSRSWNRVVGQVGLDFDDLVLSARAWYRIPEDDEDDQNPSMHRYYGYGDVRGTYAPNKNTFSAMFRPGTEHNAVELTWSYPVSDYLRVYAQYFNGYGESLLDYNARTERIGIGIALNDFLQR